MFRKTSLYSALTIAVMTTLLLMSYTLIQYSSQNHEEALLVRPPELTTEVWGIFDPVTGNLRYGSHVEDVHPIASLTKLFTAYAVMESETGDATTSITWSDLNTEGTSGKLKYGEVYSLRELLFPLLIESSNDAGVAIQRVLGENFKTSIEKILNDESLTKTAIVEPTGLSPLNVSNVRDMAHMYAYVHTVHPHITDITQLKMYLGGPTGLLNNDPVRTLASFSGGKNGFTEEAGHTFVGTVTLSNEKGDVGIVLLNSSDILKDITSITESLK